MRQAPEKVLIITYYWPPSGGAGVQRWLKFTKYLPSSGWIPVILTVKPEYAAYPSRDPSLYGEIPLDVEIHRTKATNFFALYDKDQSKIPHAGFAAGADRSLKGRISRFVRGNFFIPDPRRGWNRYAFKKARALIREENIRFIITTSPPHSTQLIGRRLKRRFPAIRWVADLRDPWTDIYYYDMFNPSFIARMADNAMEKSVLAKSDAVMTVGQTLASILERKVDTVREKIFILPNGYDEEDFEGIVPSVPEIFTITYVGTLSPSYPVNSFIRAVNEIRKGGLAVNLRFVGSIPDEIRALFPPDEEKGTTEFIKYCEHPEAIRQIMSTSMLLLVIPDHPSNRAILTGKIFEYLATEKPLLFLGPADGDAAQLLVKCGYQGLYDYNDAEGIKDFILKVARGIPVRRSGHHLEYSRRALTGHLSGLLNSLDKTTVNQL